MRSLPCGAAGWWTCTFLLRRRGGAIISRSDLLTRVLFQVPDLAQQLTAYEYQLFSLINREEFLGLKWSKPGKNERAKNIIRYITHFNRVSNWVVREIVTWYADRTCTPTDTCAAFN